MVAPVGSAHLSDPLLRVEPEGEAADSDSILGCQWVRSLASWHGPSPTTALRVFMICAVCAGTLEYHVKYAKVAGAEAGSTAEVQAVNLEAEPSSGDSTGSIITSIIMVLLVLLLVAIIVAVVALHIMMIRSVHEAFARFDSEYLGARLKLVTLTLNVFTGRFHCKNLVVESPAGYKQDHLLTAADVTFRVDMFKLMTTRGYDFMVEELRMKKVDVIVEYNQYLGGKSNIQTILDHMGEHMPSIQKAKQRDHEIGNFAGELSPHDEDHEAADHHLDVKRVVMTNIGMMLATKVGSVRHELADLAFPHPTTNAHFLDEVTNHCLDDVAYLLLKSLATQVKEEIIRKGLHTLTGT